MAEAYMQDNVSDASNTPNDEITCSLCLEEFKDPRLLPCFHTYCKICLDELIKTSGKRESFLCPLCRTPYPIPKKGDCNFPQNFYIDALLQTKHSKGKLCNICSVVDVLAEKRCLDCSQDLCLICFNYHMKFAATKSHRVIALSPEDRRMTKISYCTKHRSEVLMFLCKKCNESVCRDCKLTAHEGHPSVDLADVSEAAKQNLTDTGQLYQSHLTKLYDSKHYVERYTASLQSDGKNVEKNIAACVDKMCQLIMKAGRNLQDNLKKQLSDKISIANDKEKEIQTSIRSCKQIVEHIEHVTELGSTADIIGTNKSVKKLSFSSKTAIPDMLEDTFCLDWKRPKSLCIDLEKTKINFESFSWRKPFVYLSATKIRSFRCSLFTNQKIISFCLTPDNTVTVLTGHLHGIGGFDFCRPNLLRFSETGVCSSQTRLPDVRDITCTKSGNVVYYRSSIETLDTQPIAKTEENSVENMAMQEKICVLSLTRNIDNRIAALCDKKIVYLFSLDDRPSVIKRQTLSNVSYPTRISARPNGDYCVVDIGKDRVVIFNAKFDFKADLNIIPPPNEVMNEPFLPSDVCCDSKGDLFVSDIRNSCVIKFTLDSENETYSILKMSTKLRCPTALAVDAKNRLWVADDNDRLSVFDVSQKT